MKYVTLSNGVKMPMFFPVNPAYYSGNTLGELSLTWYGDTIPDMTLEIVNTMT